MALTWNETRNTWEGDAASTPPVVQYETYADLPDPTLMAVGALALVLRDPSDFKNGLHLALGNGANADYWVKT